MKNKDRTKTEIPYKCYFGRPSFSDATVTNASVARNALTLINKTACK